MTQKCYYRIPMVSELEVKALACVEKGGRYHITTDSTIIFPEGGGQLSDSGFIGSAAVKRAYEESGEIWHECNIALTVGDTYLMKLEVDARIDHTEQHTGEHILSGLAKSIYGAVNVGFHMAEDYCTIDLDRYLDEEDLAVLEREANLVVRRNLPICSETVTPEELSAVQLRKKADGISGEVRIVYIDNGRVDSCTCCGTHFSSTGRVGTINITDSQRYKGGTRLWFACGGRAVSAVSDMQKSVTMLARRFSTSRQEMPQAVIRQGDELAAIKRELRGKTMRLCALLAEKLVANAATIGKTAVIVAIQEGLAAQDVKQLTDDIVANASCIVLIFGNYGDNTYYRMACTNPRLLPMNELCQAVNAATGGKGGGNTSFAQGSAKGNIHPDIATLMENYIKRRIG